MADLGIRTIGGAFKPMLAKVYTPGKTLLRWPVAVQPKYDGVRALWDGERVRSRSGKDTLVVPGEIMEVLQQDFRGIALDGELYAHGVGFEAVVSAARGGGAGASMLQYVVFDRPTSEGFEDRVTHLQEMLLDVGWANGHDVQKYERVVLAPWVLVERQRELDGWMEQWTGNGYEGVMIRELGKGYEERRTSQLLKWKRTLTAKATVTAIEPGKGKHAGRMGALWVCGEGASWTCKIGTGFSNVERERGVAEWLGATVTVAFQEFSAYGVPRFPRYAGLAESDK